MRLEAVGQWPKAFEPTAAQLSLLGILLSCLDILDSFLSRAAARLRSCRYPESGRG